jgi:hypothetical protein
MLHFPLIATSLKEMKEKYSILPMSAIQISLQKAKSQLHNIALPHPTWPSFHGEAI